jgi:hypothetical protein
MKTHRIGRHDAAGTAGTWVSDVVGNEVTLRREGFLRVYEVRAEGS